MSDTRKIQRYGWKPDHPDHRDRKFKIARHLITSDGNVQVPKTVDLRHLMPPVYDQGNLGSCHDGETEVLTRDGWKLFANTTTDDKFATVDPVSKELIFENPSRLVRFHYKGEIHRSSHQSLDFALTPDHKMVVRKWDESSRTLTDDYHFVEMKNLGWYTGLINSVEYKGTKNTETCTIKGVNHKHAQQRHDKIVKMDDWLRFIGIYLAEGTLLQPSSEDRESGSVATRVRKTYSKIQLAASKVREKVYIRELLDRLEINYTELEDRFTFQNMQIYTAMESLGLKGVKSPFKFVPDFVFDLPANQIKCLLEGYFMGDGAEQDGHISYYTSSKQLADDVQRLILLSGGWSTISSREPRESVIDERIVKGNYPEYRVSQWGGRSLSIDRKEHTYTEQYNGEVFCAEVPTYHTLVTRRNGKMLISSNCTANSIGGLFEYLLMKEGKPSFTPSRLFVYYRERVLEGTVNEDSGAQIRDGMASCATKGAPPETLWSYDITRFAEMPPRAAYKEAANHRFKEYHRLDNTQLSQLLACLANGFPFTFGFTVYESFESDEVARTGVAPMPSKKERVLGGHAVLAVGYDYDKKVFIVRNSWGTPWGMEGYFTLPFDYVTNEDLADDFWTATLL